MNSNVYYRGLREYSKDTNRFNINRKILLVIAFIIVLLIAIFYGRGIYTKVNIIFSPLSKVDIQYYIDVADKVSSEKAQVNWQEVAALNIVLNNGNKNETVEKLSEQFLYKNKAGLYSVLTVEEVISDLKIKHKEKKEILNKLKSIEGNALSDLVKEDKGKRDFIDSIYKQAVENYNDYGILPSITLAQAILESGWGQSDLAKEHNNLFGIKADKRWSGSVATMVTKENYDDTINANFRKYDSTEESIKDHGEFLYSSSRYKDNGVFEAADYINQAQALENAGYSTAKDENGQKIYADKLVDVIRKYNLMLYDSKIKQK